MDYKHSNERTWIEDEHGNVLALLDHPETEPGIVVFSHTEVDPSLSGQGIAGRITQEAAERLRAEGRKAVLSCSYSIRWFAKHPEYADVLAEPEKEKEKAAALAGPACGIPK